MLKKTVQITLFYLFISCVALAQQTEWFTLNQAYKTGIELFQKGKYAAASHQFSKVDEVNIMPSTQPADNRQLSLLKENAQFYQALCALNLGNQNAEGLFLKFIREYPVSANTKSAYFHVGSFYFDKKNYQKAIEWFEQIDAYSLTSAESDEYQFKLAYSHFTLKNYSAAEPIFAKLKDQKSEYAESSIYYYAYLNYLDADYKTALREFERLKDSKTYQASYPYYISALYFLDKRYDDVLSYTIPAIETIDAKYKADMYRIVGATYFAKAEYKNSADYYKKFQDIDQGKTQNNQDSYQIGYLHLKLGSPQKAITELEKMESPDVFYQNGMIVLGDAFIKTGNKQSARNAFFRASKLDFDPTLKEEGLINYAKLSYELEFHTVALDAVQSFIKTYPNSTKINEAKTLLGKVLLSTKNYKDAVTILESIANKNEDTREVYQRVTYYRGLEFYNERAFENSISMFMRSVNNPLDAEIEALATYWLAEAMFEVRKYGESVEQFERFLSLQAARSTDVFNYANYALGYSAFQNDSFNKSANYFQRFLNGNEKDRNTLNDATLRLADSHFVLRNYDHAMVQYNKIIAWNAQGEDYALFQKGMIQGLLKQNDAKIGTLQSLLSKYPKSNYADDAGFETAYTYFNKGENDRAKADLTELISKYPRSSYIPRALVTVGLVNYNQDKDEEALVSFQRVVTEYPTSDEAKLALESIKNIYLDKSDAEGFLAYANTTSIGNLSTAEQDNITFQAVNNRFLKGEYQGAFESVNAYFDKFPKPIHEKHARFIRAESLVKINRPDEAIPDYSFILNDWTSEYTERALISISKLYLQQQKYNEAVVYLKKLELTSEYKSNYGFAVNNLMEAYNKMGMPDDVLKYVTLIRNFDKASNEDKYRAGLYAGNAYLVKADTATAVKEFTEIATKTTTVTGTEARYQLANIQYLKGDFKGAQKAVMALIKETSNDYWNAKAFLLLADTYAAQKDVFQAKATLQSILDNYEGKDDILPAAKAKLEQLNKK